MKLRDLPPFRFFAGRERARLMRDYFLVSLLLVGGGLTASGLIEIYFSFDESQQHLARLQREIATGAAVKIERFVHEIHNTLKGATRSREIAPKGLTEEFRFELEKLLLIAPAITEAVALNENGAIQVQASRLRTVLPEIKKEYAILPAFLHAKQGNSYFGPVYFVRGSEPYMTVAVPIERFAGVVIGVLQAEVNLKYIGDVVTNLTIGKAGYSYVVSRSGELISHPDISLVLQRRNVLKHESTMVAFGEKSRTADQRALVTPNIQGKTVLSASALVADFGWAVIVERPVVEAFEPVYASMYRSAALLLLGLGLALLASFFLARRVIHPLRVLREGVERIGTGDLGYRLSLKTGDEIEVLADEFNKMTHQLQESYTNLEQKVEDRTRELSESLEQQTTTSGILGIIASSPTDLQPVLDALAESAARLCEASNAQIYRADGNILRLAACHGSLPATAEIPIVRSSVVGRVFLDRQSIHIEDLAAEVETEFPSAKEAQGRFGHRTLLATPLLREGIALGVIGIRRTEVRLFTDKQIALLKTFADQAVIAIENVRLFQELQARTGELARSVEELKALGEVGQAISSTLDLQTVLTTIVSRAVELSETDGGIVYEFQEPTQTFFPVASERIEEEFVAALRDEPIRLGEGAVGRAAITRAPVQITDIGNEQAHASVQLRPLLTQLGYRSLLAVPLLRERRVIGGLVLLRRRQGDFSPALINLIETLATQSVLGIQNARLFREIEETNEQLEVASKHKSQFLANVSHELRTPLNSIIGFTRIVLRRSEGKIDNLQKENLQKVLISGEHLLNLINGLLDLAKIEAGHMEVYAETFKLEEIVRVATATVEPMLRNGNVRLVTEIAADLPLINSDRDKLKQVVLNLLSNSAKFTEKGEIKVAAWTDNGSMKLAVSDTGIGMNQQALTYIFEEFRQVDMSTTRKYGGTGLGLAIVKRLTNLLGGDIAVESEEGKGTKFTVTLPMELKQ